MCAAVYCNMLVSMKVDVSCVVYSWMQNKIAPASVCVCSERLRYAPVDIQAAEGCCARVCLIISCCERRIVAREHVCVRRVDV